MLARKETVEQVTRWCLAHKRIVGAFWLLLTLGGLATSSGLADRLDKTFSLPGQKGYETNLKILAAYGTGGDADAQVVVVHLPAGTTTDDPTVVAAVARGMAAVSDPRLIKAASAAAQATLAKRTLPPYRVVGYPSARDPAFVSADRHTTFALVFVPRPVGFSADNPVPAINAAFTKAALLPPDSTVGTTGLAALREDSAAGKGGGAGVLTEALLGGAGALIVLAFVFGSFVALLPLLMAVVAIMTCFAIVTLLTTVVSVSFIVQFLIALIGLGVAIDYALLVVTRWREERLTGSSNEEAVVTAMRTAGHSVVFSGVTVAVGLLALVFLPVPFLRSVGYGGMIIPLVSVAVATTLLPVLLSKAGPFLDRPRLRRNPGVSRPWAAWARFVVRNRWLATAAALAILIALGTAALNIKVGDPDAASLSKGGPAATALHTLERSGISSGALTPLEVLVPSGDTRPVLAAARAVPGVRGAAVSGTRPGAAVVDVIPVRETTAVDVVTPLRRALEPLGAEVGGVGASNRDFNSAVYGSFPIMILIIVIVTYVLLARAFRSLVLPLKAVLLNLISVGATYGVLVLVWQEGHGSQAIWGIPATGAITSFVPLMVFAFLFGLSMDYEVFILARMREEYDESHSTTAAIVQGVGRTGRLVTSAALILFLAFLALSQGPDTDIKIFATGLGAGILLDATVVRALLVPALVALLGRWNWALPQSVARPLRVAPSPLQPDLETTDRERELLGV